jgi:hypothetical protein
LTHSIVWATTSFVRQKRFPITIPPRRQIISEAKFAFGSAQNAKILPRSANFWQNGLIQRSL